MMQRGKVLIVDDDDLVRESLRMLFRTDYDVIVCGSGAEAIEAVEAHPHLDAVVLDIKMAHMDGLETAARIKKIRPDLPIIFYTGYPGDYSETDIEGEHAPFEYVIKNEQPVRIKRSVKNAVALHQLKNGGGDLSTVAARDFGMVGRSPEMLDVYRTIMQVAPSSNKVMILGETGTGKELVARAIHKKSRRADRRLAILNCNHKSPDLVESELFGHTRGAFTGAVADRVGLFEYADGGTVFLDEIGDLDITTQAKLLRVLETGEMQKIGSPEYQRVDIRIICATHRDLQALVDDDRFREDLYYRLRGVTITLPPLRRRREDIPYLVTSFTESYCSREGDGIRLFDPAAMDIIFRYDWPGNVRQLRDTVESLLVLTDSAFIGADDVARFLANGESDNTGPDEGLVDRVRSYEKALISEALAQCDSNISRAARLLKTDRSNLHKKVKQYHITLPCNSSSNE